MRGNDERSLRCERKKSDREAVRPFHCQIAALREVRWKRIDSWVFVTLLGYAGTILTSVKRSEIPSIGNL